MMRIEIQGEQLDLYSGQALTFANINPLFAFDNIACERTAEFAIPLTAKNMRLFGCAHIPAYYGAGMRSKISAKMIDGVVVKSGYLYVSGYNGSAFSAVFVCGQLVGLQRLKDCGKLAEAGTFSDAAVWGALPINASAAANVRFGSVRYYQDKGTIFPSASLKYIVDTIANDQRVSISIPDEAKGLRIIPDEPHGFEKSALRLSSVVSQPSQPSADEPEESYNTLAVSIQGLFAKEGAVISTRILNVKRYYLLSSFLPLQAIKMTFGYDWPETRYVVHFDADSGEQTFLGDRSFTKSQNGIVRTEGEPLAGRTIEIARGTSFIFVDSADYQNESASGVSSVGWRFGFGAQGMAFDYALTIEGEAEQGCTLLLRDNLPDITITDLLKYVAAITGKQLNYTEEDGVSFDPINLETWPVLDISGKLLKMSQVKRTFGSYAQSNLVEFATAGNVPAADRLQVVYEIDNETISAESVLQKIDLSEGAKQLVSGVDFFRNPNETEEADKFGIARAGSAAYMNRVSLTPCEGIDALCTSSTAIVVEISASLYEFSKIVPQTLLLLNGTRYVWTDATWTNGVAKISLSKI